WEDPAATAHNRALSDIRSRPDVIEYFRDSLSTLLTGATSDDALFQLGRVHLYPFLVRPSPTAPASEAISSIAAAGATLFSGSTSQTGHMIVQSVSWPETLPEDIVTAFKSAIHVATHQQFCAPLLPLVFSSVATCTSGVMENGGKTTAETRWATATTLLRALQEIGSDDTTTSTKMLNIDDGASTSSTTRIIGPTAQRERPLVFTKKTQQLHPLLKNVEELQVVSYQISEEGDDFGPFDP
ncbi:unnamed protein product, partial [Amoebophrya sp. A25]